MHADRREQPQQRADRTQSHTSTSGNSRTTGPDENPFLGRAHWAPITCARNSIRHFAFDGDIHTRLHQLDLVPAEEGWTGGARYRAH